jgi:predicted methyltransferase
MRARTLLLSLAVSLLAACATTPAPEPVATPEPLPPPAMAPPAAVAAAVGSITAALAAPGRTDADRERDARDHPAEVLALAGFGPGMVIGDVFGGGGYYSEILATVVGPTGRIRLVNNPAYDAFAKKTLEPRLAGGRLANVDYTVVPPEALGLGTATLDGALIVMSYHDLYFADPKDGWPPIDASQFIDQLVAALKPGATLLIVDHQARPGSGRADTQDLHRIEDTFAIADFRAHGLELVRSTELLRNPDDDHTKNVFDPAIRGKTDRFVHVYIKPAT